MKKLPRVCVWLQGLGVSEFTVFACHGSRSPVLIAEDRFYLSKYFWCTLHLCILFSSAEGEWLRGPEQRHPAHVIINVRAHSEECMK